MRWRRSFLTVAVVTAIGLAPAAGTATAQPTSSPGANDVTALVEASMVRLYVETTARVKYYNGTGMVNSPKEYKVGSSCSGFFISTSGHIASAGHCVEPAMVRDSIIKTFLSDQIKDNLITEATAQEILTGDLRAWKILGTNEDDPPSQQVFAFQPKDIKGAVLTDDPITVPILGFRPFLNGDTALLKAEVSNSTALAFATETPKKQTEVLAVGWPGSVDRVSAANLQHASFESGDISNDTGRSQAGVPQIQISAPVSQGMSGGPTVDRATGNVIGVNSFYPAGENQPFNFVTGTDFTRQWFQSQGVPLVPPRVVSTPQDAVEQPLAAESSTAVPLWAWALIAAFGLVVIAIVFVVLIQARRRSARMPVTQPVAAGPGITCGNCRAPSQTGRFCSSCGSALPSG